MSDERGVKAHSCGPWIVHRVMDVKELLSALASTASLGTPPALVKTRQDSQRACRSCYRMHTVLTLHGLELIKACLLWHLIIQTKVFPLIPGFEPRVLGCQVSTMLPICSPSCVLSFYLRQSLTKLPKLQLNSWSSPGRPRTCYLSVSTFWEHGPVASPITL